MKSLISKPYEPSPLADGRATQRWTDAELCRLDRFVAAGWTSKRIGVALGRSEKAVERVRAKKRGNAVRDLVGAIEAETVPALKTRLRKRLIMVLWVRRRGEGRAQ